ncbi:hypothetical protein ALI44B_00790 [Leifsonia sp. ALI-44-B]|uniref:hypothetical protein n=1 Tax=Leifsonia sp. ALI-44-B TaxID=1933776 RepID=UPI00097C4DF1|nr:hypothetical protein [Leifsonia sp. ALI-44-B]ONI65262.1 hypothetical protein ALI44B_00790 [Leifsonia sp. ALI-44-B]
MERISYAAENVRTGTEISRAVLAYAECLARHGTSATVDIPIRGEDGTDSRANILLGPASQLIAEKYDDDQPEIVDAALVEKIRDNMRRLEGGPAQPLDLHDPDNLNIYEDLA